MRLSPTLTTGRDKGMNSGNQERKQSLRDKPAPRENSKKSWIGKESAEEGRVQRAGLKGRKARGGVHSRSHKQEGGRQRV